MDYFKDMAHGLYEDAKDLDYMDYEEYREEEENLIASALKKVQDMADDNADFVALWNVLTAIYD